MWDDLRLGLRSKFGRNQNLNRNTFFNNYSHKIINNVGRFTILFCIIQILVHVV